MFYHVLSPPGVTGW